MRRKHKILVETTVEELAKLLGHPDWELEHVNEYDKSHNKTTVVFVFMKEWRDDGPPPSNSPPAPRGGDE